MKIQKHLFLVVIRDCLFKGSLNSTASVESREEGLTEMSVPPKHPITMEYQSHDSPIYSVSFSPFHRHLFLTSGHDGQMRIYSQLFVRSTSLSLILFICLLLCLVELWSMFCSWSRSDFYMSLVTITSIGSCCGY